MNYPVTELEQDHPGDRREAEIEQNSNHNPPAGKCQDAEEASGSGEANRRAGQSDFALHHHGGSFAGQGNWPRSRRSCWKLAGVKTVQDLRYRNPENLAEAMAKAKAEKNGRALPSAKMIDPLDRKRQKAQGGSDLLRLVVRFARLTVPARPRKATAWRQAPPRPETRPLSRWLTCWRRGGTLVMGILNITPDSFSDGGKFIDPAAAIAHARQYGRRRRRYHRHRRRIDPALRRNETGDGRRGMATPATRTPGRRGARRAGFDRHHEGGRCRLGARRRRRHRQRRLGTAARSRHGAGGRRTAVLRVVACTTATSRDAPDIMANIAAFFERTLEIAAHAGIAPRSNRPRPRHRLRNDARSRA